MDCCLCFNSIAVALAVVFAYLAAKFMKPKQQQISSSLKDKHVLVTGGSSGIGKCVAIDAAKRGAHVTIVARNQNKLETAVNDIKKYASYLDDQKIQHVSFDVSRSYEEVENTINILENNIGPVYMLVNCAGTSLCGKLEDSTPKDIRALVDLNILGTIHPTKALIGRMKNRNEGKIVLVSSQAGLLGIFGFSVYSATKFALRGLAEALKMEVEPYNISVTLALPPDTDTPGFAEEQKTKPIETRLISETAGILKPEVVADQMMEDAMKGKFFSIVGFESAMVTTMCAGMAPFSTFFELTTQVFFAGILRLVGVLCLWQFNGIVKKCATSKDKNKRSGASASGLDSSPP